VSGLERQKARHTTLLLYSFRMTCLSPTSSFLQMTKSAVSCLKLCHLVAFLLEEHDTGSKTALPMCFHFASKSSIPGLESLAREGQQHTMGFLLEVRQASSLVERFGAIIPACQPKKSRFHMLSSRSCGICLTTHAHRLWGLGLLTFFTCNDEIECSCEVEVAHC
jgi:hypothetical protein